MIRKYKEKEIPTLIKIWEQASALAHPFLDSAFTQMVKKVMAETYLPNSNTWVYEEPTKVVGFISMIENEIGGLFVNPNYHSKGIGTALVNHINQFHQSLEVEVFNENKIGKPFYEKHGFKTFKEYIQEGTNQKVLRMKKIIK
ncbi:GNAT family N-acetyltransferase [Flavivirga amylovorans]|uniref:GNAT family N-acetyltransferase n=1 Tax=Flavivirga amylovorans TaxID=870486 RepID=A0ABT8WXP3_9FLAO|nr:GNAT family N-acetyltransferase [Flavivirga amylovorans]MDO5986459.1 GNAT family N-acetyltransferase [Flavivirga amylovorans]